MITASISMTAAERRKLAILADSSFALACSQLCYWPIGCAELALYFQHIRIGFLGGMQAVFLEMPLRVLVLVPQRTTGLGQVCLAVAETGSTGTTFLGSAAGPRPGRSWPRPGASRSS